MTITSSSNTAASAFPPPDIHEADQLYDNLQHLEDRLNQSFLGNENAVRLLLTSLLARGFPLLSGPTGTGKSYLLASLARELGIHIDFMSPLSHPLVEHPPKHSKQGSLFPLIEDTLLIVQNAAFLSREMCMEVTQKMQKFSSNIPSNTSKISSCIFLAGTQDSQFTQPKDPVISSLMDHFILNIPISYPSEAIEKEIVLSTTGISTETRRKHRDLKTVLKTRDFIRRIPIGESIVNHIQKLIRSLRPQSTLEPMITDSIDMGPSTRAIHDFIMAIRAYALLSGRLAPDMNDINHLAVPLLEHRIIPREPTRQNTRSVKDCINFMLEKLSH